jgi:pimeloyl-ACP methyl ester carboxylesterase
MQIGKTEPLSERFPTRHDIQYREIRRSSSSRWAKRAMAPPFLMLAGTTAVTPRSAGQGRARRGSMTAHLGARRVPVTTLIEELTFDVDGGQLALLAAGPPEGERVLLLHGIPANAQLFRDVLPILAEAGYRALAPHMPGYGTTRLADDADYSLSADADRYARWLETHKLGPVWLVGHDLGGAIAQLMAARYPRLISKLTMGDAPTPTSFPVRDVSIFILAAKLRLVPTLKLLPNPHATAALRRAFHDPSRLSGTLLRAVFYDDKVQTMEGRREFAKHLRHLRNTENVQNTTSLKGLRMPILLLWGEDDRYQRLDTTGKQLQALLPDGTPLEVIPDAGHFAPLEQPAAYARGLLDWRRSL